MAERLTNITDPKYRCSIGACPAVYEDITHESYKCVPGTCPGVHMDKSGNFIFIGKRLDPFPDELSGKVSESEDAIELPRELVLASLGMSDLIKAAERVMRYDLEILAALDNGFNVTLRSDVLLAIDDLRTALDAINSKG